MCQEVTVEEWEANFDEIFEKVEQGETFIIRSEDGKSCYLMPIDKYNEAQDGQ